MHLKRLFLLFFALLNFAGSELIFAKNDDTYVLIISFDGFRYDYLDRGISPNLVEFANSGVRASSFKPIFPTKTFPSHISIMTGLKAGNHGIVTNSFVDPYSGEAYRIGNKATHESKWYQGEFFWETAKKNGIITASYFWPGSEINYEERRAHYVESYEHNRPYEERISGVVEWLMMPDSLRPRFITLYFDATDSYGHKFGTESDSLNHSISMLDDIFGKLLNKLDIAGWKDKLNIIVLSDHGMLNVEEDKKIKLEKFVNKDDLIIQNYGPFAMISALDKSKLEQVYSQLEGNDYFQVYWKEKIPERYGLKHNPRVSEIFVLADPGYALTLETDTYSSYATHGWDNEVIEMHGIFLANGPKFKERVKIGTVNALDVYPLLCELFGIKPSRQIDGDLDNIEFIIKNK